MVRQDSSSSFSRLTSVFEASSVADKFAEFCLEFSSSFLSVSLSAPSLVEIAISRDSSESEIIPLAAVPSGEQYAGAKGTKNKASDKNANSAT